MRLSIREAQAVDVDNLKQNGRAVISEFEKSPLELKLKCRPWSGWLKKLMSIKMHVEKYAQQHPDDADIQLMASKLSVIEDYVMEEDSVSYPQSSRSIKYYNEQFGTNLVENS